MLSPQTSLPVKIEYEEWLNQMKETWSQGEHVSIMGPTGSGKTTVASDLLRIRRFVVVIALKPKDETLKLYKGFYIIHSWPPDFNRDKVIFWLQPRKFTDISKQAVKVARALEYMYVTGGWTIYLDEAGLMSGPFYGLRKHMAILLNQGRSLGLTLVMSMTQPHSVVAQMPSEALKQTRHIVIFRYTNMDEAKSAGIVAGIDFKTIISLMSQLGKHDFIAVSEGKHFLVKARN